MALVAPIVEETTSIRYLMQISKGNDEGVPLH
jgi:hypothetical protein